MIYSQNMRLALTVLMIFLIASTIKSYAESITTGDATAKSSVTNTVQGGNVETHIEVEANGEKKVLDTTEPGTHKLEVGNSASAEVDIKGSTPSGEEEDGDGKEKTFQQPQAVIQKIFDAISELFKKILSLFG